MRGLKDWMSCTPVNCALALGRFCRASSEAVALAPSLLGSMAPSTLTSSLGRPGPPKPVSRRVQVAVGRILLLLTAVPPRGVLPHTRLGTRGGSPGWWLLAAAPWEMGNEGQKGGDAGKRPPRRGSTGLSSAHGSVGRRKKGEKRQVSPEEEALTCSPSVAASPSCAQPLRTGSSWQQQPSPKVAPDASGNRRGR